MRCQLARISAPLWRHLHGLCKGHSLHGRIGEWSPDKAPWPQRTGPARSEWTGPQAESLIGCDVTLEAESNHITRPGIRAHAAAFANASEPVLWGRHHHGATHTLLQSPSPTTTRRPFPRNRAFLLSAPPPATLSPPQRLVAASPRHGHVLGAHADVSASPPPPPPPRRLRLPPLPLLRGRRAHHHHGRGCRPAVRLGRLRRFRRRAGVSVGVGAVCGRQRLVVQFGIGRTPHRGGRWRLRAFEAN